MKLRQQEANAVNQKEGSKKPKAPKEKGKGSEDQLSTECKHCGTKHERKETNALHTERRSLRVENPTIFWQSVLRIPVNPPRSVLGSLNARK